MKIGVPKEIKNNEFRVGLTPTCVDAYVKAGHEVFVQEGAGIHAGYEDCDYQDFGATIVRTAKECWSKDMVIKVKEPLKEEYKYFSEGKILFTYLHLASNKELTDALINSGMVCFGYETIKDSKGVLVCLEPMSVVAGKLAAQKGAEALLAPTGAGILMGGTPGVNPAKVMVIGGGSVGLNAAKVALGMGASVTILDINVDKLTQIDNMFGGRIRTLYSDTHNLQLCLAESNLIIGAVLIPGKEAPKLITEADLGIIMDGSVIVDVAIDQGGCAETSKPTTHEDPTYVVDGVVHYCVANMPSVVAKTSTEALTKTTLKYGLAIARQPTDASGGLQIKDKQLLIYLK